MQSYYFDSLFFRDCLMLPSTYKINLFKTLDLINILYMQLHCSVISEIAVLGIKICSFSWKCRFLVLVDSPIPCILGVDFMARAKVRLDFIACQYSFLFHPEQEFDFEAFDLGKCVSQKFPCAEEVLAGLGCGSLSAGPAKYGGC